ncbi:MAG: 6-phosphogluconolactonase [Gemmatimonadetes bacterium]|nr:6-phosphogluconolactonase [Gemmatimonadota bacterium]
MTDHSGVQIHEDERAAARAGAEEFRQLAVDAVASAGRFSAALTGGGSPVEMYRLLATDEFADSIPWQSVHLFWGDDRCVPPAHPRSNFGMANDLFIDSVSIPGENVHRIRGELGSAEGARQYEAELRSFFGSSSDFDLVHLGVGDDSHVASLFPFQIENLSERERWVVPALERELGEPRVSLSMRAINSARVVRMLLPNGERAGLVAKLLEGPLDPFRLPAQLVRPVNGKQHWLLTRDSARELTNRS